MWLKEHVVDMDNKPFNMNIGHVKSMAKIYNNFKFKNSKYFQLLRNHHEANKSFYLNLLRVLSSFHHYILAYLSIYGIMTIGQFKL